MNAALRFNGEHVLNYESSLNIVLHFEQVVHGWNFILRDRWITLLHRRQIIDDCSATYTHLDRVAAFDDLLLT